MFLISKRIERIPIEKHSALIAERISSSNRDRRKGVFEYNSKHFSYIIIESLRIINNAIG